MNPTGTMSRFPWKVSIYEREVKISRTKPAGVQEEKKAFAAIGIPETGFVFTQRDLFQDMSTVSLAERFKHFQDKKSRDRVDESKIDLFGPAPERKEGDIQCFSRKSRMRMFRRFNRLQTARLGKPIFLSLTARSGIITPEEFKNRFRKRFLPFLRKLIPEVVYLWRLEPHRSGRPHYHLVAWSYRKGIDLHSEYWKRKIRAEWRVCIADHSRGSELHSCKIVDIKDLQGLTRYLSKYLAKEDDEAGRKIRGRRWGVSKNFPTCPITELSITENEEKELREIAKRILTDQGKAKLWERLEEFADFGWSLWLSEDEIRLMFRELGDHRPSNAFDLYNANPPPQENES